MATGYGQDVWCGDSMVTGRLSRGVTNVVLALYRRLITQAGTLRPIDEDSDEDELDYGLDLAGECGEVGPERAVKLMPARIRAELMKDDRVLDVLVIAQPIVYASDGTAVIAFDVSGVLHEEGEQFKFTVSVQDATVELILGGNES